MNEFEPVNKEESLIKPEPFNGEDREENNRMGEFRAQAEDYGQRLQEAAVKAKDYASERFAVAGEKFKELQNKEPQELIEEAKEFARQKPGQALLISAAAGLVIGLILRGGRR